MRLVSWALPPSLQNRHNFAIFCFFGGTRKIVYAKVHWIFQNPPRKPQSHQNSDDFGINIDLICAVFGVVFLIKILTIIILGTPRDTVYPWGKGAHKQKSERYRLR